MKKLTTEEQREHTQLFAVLENKNLILTNEAM